MNRRSVAIPGRLAGGLLAVALLLVCLADARPATAQQPSVRPTAAADADAADAAEAALDLDAYETQVLREVNQRRRAHGRRPVRRVNTCVDRLSENWAGRLARTGDFVHRDQTVVLDRCHMHWAGEALARGTAMLPAGAVTAWMHSREHRAVLLKRRANRAGIGARLDGQGRVVLVLNFTDTRG